MEIDSSEANDPPETMSPPMKLISATHSVLPCRVCGKKASGFHYGANTCEACKGFFRRSLTKKGKYKCSNNKNCNIGPGNRACSKCRYEKCLTVGMSKEAIKTGRYTHQKRTQDILEVKRLESGTLDMQVETMSELENRLETFENPINEDKKYVYSPSSIQSPEFFLSEEDNLRMLSEFVIDIESFPRENTTSPADSTSTKDSTSSESNEMVEKLEQMTESLVKVHMEQVTCYSTLDVEDMEKKTSDYYKKYKLKTEMFGDLKMLPIQQYNDFYELTGIDIDDRQDRMLLITTTMDNCVRRLIIFAKAIPGFSELSINDQSNLIKASRFEFFFLGYFKGYNSHIKTFLTPENICLCAEEVSEFLKDDFISKVFAFSDSVKKLDLSYTEIVLIKAIVIMFRDRCCLDDPDRVEEIQWSLIQCLMHMLKKHRPDKPLFFAKVMDRLMAIRTITEDNYSFCKNLLLWPNIRKNPLLLEIISFDIPI